MHHRIVKEEPVIPSNSSKENVARDFAEACRSTNGIAGPLCGPAGWPRVCAPGPRLSSAARAPRPERPSQQRHITQDLANRRQSARRNVGGRRWRGKCFRPTWRKAVPGRAHQSADRAVWMGWSSGQSADGWKRTRRDSVDTQARNRSASEKGGAYSPLFFSRCRGAAAFERLRAAA